jgi:heme peroxidase
MKHALSVFATLTLLSVNLSAQSNPSAPQPVKLLSEFRPIGGSGNNIRNPSLDAVPNSPELALTPLNFAPGTNDGLVSGPNPRTISNVIAGGTGANGQNAETEDSTASAWLYVFGQFVDHDIDLEETPPDTTPINITIPPNDPVFQSGTTIAMTRDVRSSATNTIINTVAGYLDLSQLYGSTAEVAASLRNPDGTLKSTGNGQYLPVVNGAYVTGDPRVAENPELTAVTTLFMREHNFCVSQLKASNPTWTGDQLYSMAKEITTGEYQNIIYSEYLPVLIGRVLGPYRGYNSQVNAQVTQEFSTAAFRLGHSEVSDTQEGLDNNGNVTFTESLAQAFFNTPAQDEANGFDALLRGVSADFSQATDAYSVAALRNLLFAGLVGGDIDQIDLIAIDIQRERDVGLGTLNQTRQALGLFPYRSFAQVTSDPVLQQNLQNVYGNVNQLDLFMGGLAENHIPGTRVGITFMMILAKQFQALRTGDRFFWQNEDFDSQTALTIANTTLAQIILRDTDTTLVQPRVFIVPSVGRQPHVSVPNSINTHGRPGPTFN